MKGLICMAITIRIGVCTEDPRKVDKRQNFEASVPAQISVEVKENCSIMHPQLILTSSLVQLSRYNYLHIPEWGRYYWIDDLIAMPGSRIEIRCKEDVLTSNADDILGLTAYAARSESRQSKMLYNSDYHLQQDRQCQTIAFNRTPFIANYATDRVYLLTVLGGTNNATG